MRHSLRYDAYNSSPIRLILHYSKLHRSLELIDFSSKRNNFDNESLLFLFYISKRFENTKCERLYIGIKTLDRKNKLVPLQCLFLKTYIIPNCGKKSCILDLWKTKQIMRNQSKSWFAVEILSNPMIVQNVIVIKSQNIFRWVVFTVKQLILEIILKICFCLNSLALQTQSPFLGFQKFKNFHGLF